MIVVINKNATDKEVNEIKEKLLKLGCDMHESIGNSYHFLILDGNTNNVDAGALEINKCVDRIIFDQEPYKKSSRLYHPDNTEIKINDKVIGGKKLAIIAGPCSVESKEQLLSIAEDVKASGASFLRGGAFKPRTSPYSFQGLELEGLDLLKLAKQKTGLPIVTEITSLKYLDRYVEDVDIIQVGARNMQNYDMLKELGKVDKPILLKRGISATIEEFLMSAEYIMAGGNEKVILCERGIRTFENYTRNTLDLSAVPIIKKLSHLPIIVDPSHASGLWWLVEPLAKAAIAVGADGLMIEVHNDPENALCDGGESIKCKRFNDLMDVLRKMSQIEEKEI